MQRNKQSYRQFLRWRNREVPKEPVAPTGGRWLFRVSVFHGRDATRHLCVANTLAWSDEHDCDDYGRG